ncbi:NAD(P)/FAD-dependent oxidoreductase [Virgibacillus natechei]|nr:NAD(P)/FAD-dependent oxidoreductase [Virgibacillus natechei]UZD14973.1 NAD(P)/FAD-dependent oxidoreductase [Virgibacillus natechei]
MTIIGGGPTGMFAAFYGGMRNSSVKIIESLPQLGGQLAALYPEKFIYDIAGFPKISAQNLVDNLKQQMDIFQDKIDICLGETVEEVEKIDNYFILRTDNETHYTKSIIITAGNGAFEPRKLPIDVTEYELMDNVHYYVKDMQRFANKEVVVFGGGDSAVDWALMLEPIAKNVTLVHRRDKFRAHEHSVEKLKQSTLELVTPFVPAKFDGEQSLEKVILKQVKGNEMKIINADDVLVNYGFVSSLGPIKSWKLEIEKNSIVVNSKLETNIEGIYAAGDICTCDGKINLIATGFGEAATAVSNAKVFIEPNSRVQPMHSTSLMEAK